MRKVLVFLSVLCFGLLNVHAADDIYFINDNNVEFTELQYDYFSKVYFEGYQKYMTQDEFDSIDVDLMNPDLVEVVYDDSLTLTRATSITKQGRTLKITKTTAGNYSSISITCTWTSTPSVKSYDVIGARLDGITLSNTPVTRLYNDDGYTSYSISVKSTLGFGASVLLSGSNIRVTQTFLVSGSGTVYGSYQHAQKKISLDNSKKYTISSSGYGSVFSFTGTASSVYDGVGGVNISV